MLDTFLTFINDHKIPLPAQRTLLAVSGGLDSVVMADLFSKAGLAAGIAHCNFGLRGEESDADEHFVKTLAEQYGLPCYTRKFDTLGLVRLKGISTQMAARELRYPWFEEIRRAESYDYIATAHHNNDALETLLLNLVRGTGLAGLKGIAFQNDRLIRPLLFATRNDIARYADENHLTWREDSSNQSTYYRRNLLRHRVIPILKELNPSLEETFKLTAERLRAADVLLNAYQQEWQAQAVSTEGTSIRISITSVLAAPEPVFQLADVLQPYGFTYQQARQIVEVLDKQPGKLFTSSTHTLLKDRTELLLTPSPDSQPEAVLHQNDTQVSFGELTLQQQQISRTATFEFPSAPLAAGFDSEQLKYPLRVRSWQQGDWFYPMGMGGKKKKVSDLLVDLKIPRTRKGTIPLLTDSQDQIVWVVGLRADHRFRITEHTTHITIFSIPGKQGA